MENSNYKSEKTPNSLPMDPTDTSTKEKSIPFPDDLKYIAAEREAHSRYMHNEELKRNGENR